jgi:hypothetical protein
MDIKEILVNKQLKPAEKTQALSQMLLDKTIELKELIEVAENSKDAEKGTCIEALEYATQKKPGILDALSFEFVTECLKDKAPRVKWESSRVVGNTCHLFQGKLEKTVENLLDNTQHPGTVVRWSAAFALGQVIKMKSEVNIDLIPKVIAIIEKEEKNSITKIYLEAIKKAGK